MQGENVYPHENFWKNSQIFISTYDIQAIAVHLLDFIAKFISRQITQLWVFDSYEALFLPPTPEG